MIDVVWGAMKMILDETPFFAPHDRSPTYDCMRALAKLLFECSDTQRHAEEIKGIAGPGKPAARGLFNTISEYNVEYSRTRKRIGAIGPRLRTRWLARGSCCLLTFGALG